MTKLVDTVKEIYKGTVDHMKKPGNISKEVKFQKGIIQKAQRFSPSSKYLGVSGIPGVKSQKEIKHDEKAVDEGVAAANRAAAIEAAKPKPMPIQGDEELARKRAAARQRRSSGRLSTVLSDEGLG